MDYFEDYTKLMSKKPPKRNSKLKWAVVYGIMAVLCLITKLWLISLWFVVLMAFNIYIYNKHKDDPIKPHEALLEKHKEEMEEAKENEKDRKDKYKEVLSDIEKDFDTSDIDNELYGE